MRALRWRDLSPPVRLNNLSALIVSRELLLSFEVEIHRFSARVLKLALKRIPGHSSVDDETLCIEMYLKNTRYGGGSPLPAGPTKQSECPECRHEDPYSALQYNAHVNSGGKPSACDKC